MSRPPSLKAFPPVISWWTPGLLLPNSASVQNLGLQIIGRLKRDRTLDYWDGGGYSRTALSGPQTPAGQSGGLRARAHLGAGDLRQWLPGDIVFTKGYKEPDLEIRPGAKIKTEPPWAAFFTTALTLTAAQVVQKYLGRWAIGCFSKKPSSAWAWARAGSLLCRPGLLRHPGLFPLQPAGLPPGHDERSQTIGDLFRQLEEETGKLTYLERLWQYLVAFLKTVLNTLAQFCDPGPGFRAYLDAITNTFNHFSPIQGCET